MKKLFSYLMVMATLLIGGGKAMAQSVTIDGVAYTVSGDHAYVSGSNNVLDTVVVLSTVTVNGVEYPVTVIGDRAFQSKTNIVSVTLPDGIVTIGVSAFESCSNLTTINFPEGVESINEYAFRYCNMLQSVVFPESLKIIRGYAFSSCKSLISLNIPDGVTDILGCAFEYCSGLTSITLSSSLTSIDEHVFWDCGGLVSIIIPEGVTVIEKEAFNSCEKLTTVTFPKSLTSIEDKAFNYCTSLTTINIPAEAVITHVGTSAFGSTQVTFPEENGIRYMGSVAYELADRSLTEYVLKEGTTAIYSNLFSGCINMTSITIPNSVISIGENAFYGCTGLPIENGIRYADCYAIEVTDKTLTEYTLKDNVRFLGNALFQDCSAMSSVTIPVGVAEIGNHTFAGCSALTSITLPESLTSIGSHAFYTCSSLTSVDIPSRVTEIGNHTFAGCSALTSITLPESLTSIGSHAFYMCSSLTSVDIPSRVTVINDYTFQWCHALVSMTLPEGVTSIGNGAFNNCSALTTVTLSPSLTSIASDAFYQCIYLQKIINYSNLPLTQGSSNYGYVALYAQQIINVDTIIDGFWFDTDANGKHHLTYYEGTDSILTLPSEFQEGNYAIDANVFSGHSEIVSIQFPDGITSIGAGAFKGCSALTSLTLPELVTSIGASAFNGCSALTSVNIPDGVASIGNYTFFGCSSLASLTIPASVTSIGDYAFQGCTGLKELTIAEGGTTLSLGHNNTNYGGQFTECKLEKLYLGRNVTSNYGHSPFNGITTLKEVVVGDSVTFLEQYTFYKCTSLSSITLSENLTSIAREVFYNCSSLTSLHLPDSLKSIGNSAFYGCSSLASVNIPEGVPTIGEYTFADCASLDSLTIPASVTSIGDYAFQRCTGLKELILADGGKTLSLGRNGSYNSGGLFTPCKLKKLYLGRNLSYNTSEYNGYSPFCNQTVLKEVVVGDSVTFLEQYTFYNCTSLSSITLSDSLKSIGNRAFYGCSSLASVNIPEGVSAIEEYAFEGCSSLLSINLHAGVTSIGANAFSGCGILTYVYSDIESPAVLAGSSLRNKAVIYVPEGTYVPYKELFPNNIIVDGTEKEVTVHVAIPGTLGEEVLNQIPYIRNVNSLKVSGTLNNDDISTITGSMVNLLHLDLSKVNKTSVNGIGHAKLCSIVFPDSCKGISGYNERDNLTSVTLPDAVETLDNNCFQNCDQLAEVTMSANLKTIGDQAFYNCGKLKEVTFKDGDKSIGNEAFYNCGNLTSVSFGAGVESIGEYAFYNCGNLTSVSFGAGVASIGRYTFANCGNLTTLVLGDRISVNNLYSFQGCGNLSEIHIPSIEAWLNSTFYDTSTSWPNRVSSKTNLYIDGELVTDVVIPSSVTSIRSYAFSRMSGITSVTIPDGVTTISQGAFYDCNGLASVTMADGVKTIGANAFAGCDSLKTITLPSTLSNCAAGAFSGSGLTEVTCPAFFPPVTGGDVIGANNCTLYVPEWTLNRYKLANNWNLFAAIEPISGIYPSTISVYTEEGLTIPAEGLAEGYIPNLELVRYDASNVGRLTLRGEKAMPLATFTMEQTRDAGTMTSLVNYGTLTADSVATELIISANTWHYLSFPYDVKIADIATLGDWVIRRYDGASRARADFSSTWQNVPYDSILHAGEGYIWYSTNGNFTVPALENDNRNLIFANDARYTQLKEHASATVANYGWNLIGNPYPCFYDTRFMEFSSPITVRSGNSYAAYSPLDDSYILSPLEAFFVQCSADNNVVGFTAEGRQTDNTVRALTSAPQRARAANSERKVFNLYLESDSYADHTRFVINEKASLAYEISCDAAKFMSDDPAVQQLFTIEGGEHMAINERPLANGEVMLGAYFGKGGSYTIALDTRATEMEVVLIDRYTGAETDLLTGSYTFTTEAGMFTDRFAIGMKRTGDVTAIETPAAKLEVVAVEGAISIRNAAAPVHIYNAAGALVTTEHGQEVTVEVAPGIYVVKVGNAAHKVSVIK